MAYGRKDYFWGVAPEKSVFGSLQTSWTHTGANLINATATSQVLAYNVPAGYVLEVTGFQYSVDGPGHHRTVIKAGGVQKYIVYFDGQLTLNFGDGGNLTVNAGDQLYIEATNDDAMAHYFVFNGFGYLNQIVT